MVDFPSIAEESEPLTAIKIFSTSKSEVSSGFHFNNNSSKS